MSRPQPQRSTFIVPHTIVAPGASTKMPREGAPFVVVPASMVMNDDETIEPHWLDAIDAATD
jgi:hypothetical protein